MGFFSKEAREARIQKREQSIAEHKRNIAKYEQEITESNKRMIQRHIDGAKNDIDKYATEDLLLPKHTYKFTYVSGLDHIVPQIPIDIVLRNSEQKLEVVVCSNIVLTIPLRDIKGSELTTDAEIPENDVKNKYMFYSHLKYLKDGHEQELVISNFQINGTSVSNIGNNILLFDYAINHLDISTQKFEEKRRKAAEREAQFQQKNAEHLARRDEHIKQLNEQVGQLKDMFRGTDPSQQNQIPVEPSAPTPASTQTASPADELRKYKSLLDDGIITQEEFEAKKKQLLGL